MNFKKRRAAAASEPAASSSSKRAPSVQEGDRAAVVKCTIRVSVNFEEGRIQQV